MSASRGEIPWSHWSDWSDSRVAGRDRPVELCTAELRNRDARGDRVPRAPSEGREDMQSLADESRARKGGCFA